MYFLVLQAKEFKDTPADIIDESHEYCGLTRFYFNKAATMYLANLKAEKEPLDLLSKKNDNGLGRLMEVIKATSNDGSQKQSGLLSTKEILEQRLQRGGE